MILPAPRKFPQELRERVMRLASEARKEDPELTLNAAVVRIGQRTGVNSGTLRVWCKQAAIDAGDGPVTTTTDAKTKDLEAEFRELKRANEILVAASSSFARGARPATSVVIMFIDDHKDRFGVVPICRVLTEHGCKIAPSGHYAFKTRPASARTKRDAEVVLIRDVFFDRRKGRGISGARKIWQLLKREGVDVSRCTVERLMRQEGLQGIRRGKQFVTPKTDQNVTRPPDRVKREFTADAPNELWVVDFTYVHLVRDGVHRVRD